MSENTNTTTNGQATATERVKVNHGPFGTLEEANAHKPQDERFRLWRVTAPDGKVCFVWHRHNGSAVTVAAKAAGWKVTSTGKPVSKDKVADMLSQLSDEDRAILIRQYVPATTESKKGKK